MPTLTWIVSFVFSAGNVTVAALWIDILRHHPLDASGSPPEIGWDLTSVLILYFMGAAHVGTLIGLLQAYTYKQHRPHKLFFWSVVAWCAATFAAATALGFLGFVFFAAPAC